MNLLNLNFLRRNDYTPLPSNGGSPVYQIKRGYSRRALLAALIFVASLILNVCLILFPKKYFPKGPLDNYQTLNLNPLVDASVLPLSNPNEPVDRAHEHAVVTSLYTNSFAGAVATLGHSLRQANTTARLIVLYLPDRISPSALCIATASGFVAHPVKRIPPPNNGKGVYSHFLDQFTKLNVWTLDQIGVRSLVYLDADTLVRRSFDELFALPFTFGAVPDVFTDGAGFPLQFNAGMLFVRPSTSIFNDMVSKLTTAHYPPVDAEQSFLNHYFGAEVVRLPYAYNGNLAIKARTPSLWEGTLPEQRVVHFTLIKPFIGRGPIYKVVEFEDVEKFIPVIAEEYGGMFRPEMTWWGGVFKDMKRTYSERLGQCRTMPPPPP